MYIYIYIYIYINPFIKMSFFNQSKWRLRAQLKLKWHLENHNFTADDPNMGISNCCWLLEIQSTCCVSMIFQSKTKDVPVLDIEQILNRSSFVHLHAFTLSVVLIAEITIDGCCEASRAEAKNYITCSRLDTEKCEQLGAPRSVQAVQIVKNWIIWSG